MRRLLLLPTVALGLILAGCASLEPQKSHSHEVRGDYVAAVDKVAERKGVTVVWINPPTRQRTRDIEYVTEVTVERQP